MENDSKKAITDKLISLGNRIWVGSIVVGGSALLGLIIAIYQPEISSAFPFPLLEGKTDFTGELKWEAVGFWTLFIIIILLASAKEMARETKTKELHTQLHERISEVREIALTMPPKDYLLWYHRLFNEMSAEVDNTYHGVSWALKNNKADLTQWRSFTNQNIRIVLDSILNLAIVFDSPQELDNTKYAAGISWIIPKEDLPEDDYPRIWELANPLSRHENQEGFLASSDLLIIHDVNLSTTPYTEAKTDIDCIKPIIYGWEDREEELGAVNIFGPPQAYGAQNFSHVFDSHQEHLNLAEYGSSAQAKILKYFTKHTTQRSFISMRISGVGPSVDTPTPIAILTLCREVPSIMGDDTRAKMFYHQITPFLSLLFRLCWLRLQLDVQHGGRTLSLYTKVDDTATEEAPSDAQSEGEP